MAELQQFFTQMVYNASDLIPLGYAFGAGMVSSVNPCGFAMLPAYLGLYLGSRQLGVAGAGGGPARDGTALAVAVPAQLARAVLVSAVITAGFITLFGGAGVVITVGGRFIVALVPWLALAIGGVLVLMGAAMLLGRRFTASFAAGIAERVGDPGSVGVKGYFVFGVAYATASLSCTLPIFLTVVGAQPVRELGERGWRERLAQHVEIDSGGRQPEHGHLRVPVVYAHHHRSATGSLSLF